ncbi:MAG TPA: ATP phosphoribosyltransferase [Longimicrobium sp.]
MRKTILALPKNCVLGPLVALLERAGITLDAPVADPGLRRFRLPTSDAELEVVLVRNWDTVTLLEMGAAHLAITGSDVLMERGSRGVVPLLDLQEGRCRLSLAAPAGPWPPAAPEPGARVRVATSYPAVTRRHFRERGVEAECVVLQGSVEMGPLLGLGEWVVDIVDTGRTLREHGLVEVECIAQVSACLVAARTYHECRPDEVDRWRSLLEGAVLAAV